MARLLIIRVCVSVSAKTEHYWWTFKLVFDIFASRNPHLWTYDGKICVCWLSEQENEASKGQEKERKRHKNRIRIANLYDKVPFKKRGQTHTNCFDESEIEPMKMGSNEFFVRKYMRSNYISITKQPMHNWSKNNNVRKFRCLCRLSHSLPTRLDSSWRDLINLFIYDSIYTAGRDACHTRNECVPKLGKRRTLNGKTKRNKAYHTRYILF